MKKVIALSSVLALSALGMACGDAGNTNTATNKPANTNMTKPATPTPAPATNAAPSNTNAKPATNAAPSNSNAKPATSNTNNR